jgi:hypothetical protein
VVSWEIFGHVRTPAADEAVSTTPAAAPTVPAPVFTAGEGPTPICGGVGICAGGRPLPAGLDGIAQFLNRSAEANVEVSYRRLPEPFHSPATAPPSRGSLEELMVHGICLQSFESWVQIRFPRHRIRVTHYAISSIHSLAIKASRLLCSNDGDEWMTVHKHAHQGSAFSLDHSGIQTYELATVECSFLRIQLQPGSLGALTLSGFEVFGSMFEFEIT